MRKLIFLVLVLPLLSFGWGCRTVSGIIGGPIMGGPSLTARFYRQEVPDYAKVMGTPFVFTTGFLTGPLVSIWRGVSRDVTHFGTFGDAEDYWYVLDPFDGGLFNKKADSSHSVAKSAEEN